MNRSTEPIVVEQSFKSSLQTVWNAITELDQMRLWFFENIESFIPEVGFETQFNVESEQRDFLHIWKLTEVDPLKKIRYLWKYGGFSGESFVSFELSEQNKHTVLQLICEGLENFPNDIPEFTRDSCIAGWNYFIKDRLRIYLQKKS